ncbi:glycosyltransferase [Rhizobium sp. SGZ-381]|uniref:glycosyltransferase n=1 Tax=Rhizobium sp. SGZ-381 TaxID=3342800 RepID=UPI00366EBA96
MRARFADLAIIVDFHNVESRLYRDIRLSRWPRWLRPLGALLAVRRFRKAEAADRKAVRLATAVWTCSQQDLDLVAGMGEKRHLVLVPNPIPAWCLEAPASAPAFSPGNEVLFVGHLGYAPNKLAVRELSARIMPKLVGLVPDARLHVCGRSPAGKLARLLEEGGARLTADPADLRPIYAAAAVAAIPLRQGSGTRLKVLEALATGCPVVATQKAVEGLGLKAGQHYLAAETVNEFARQLAQVLKNPALKKRLIEEGRSFVLAQYGPSAREKAVRSALLELIPASGL